MRIPVLSALLNDFFARLPGLRRLCLVQAIVCRPTSQPVPESAVSVSVIVPCRNERNNIQAVVERIPQMGRETEVLFSDDGSTDGTPDEVVRVQQAYPGKKIRLIRHDSRSKALGVWKGFRAATGDVLMILDGDVSVMPEELPSFLRALTSGRGEFINGSRLVYPIPRQAMKFTNMAGNKVFAALFSLLLSQRMKDTLCGTKAMWRKDWERMQGGLGEWGIRDLWGDFELLLGAAKLNLQIVEVPIHYQERVYGISKMTKVFKNGARLLLIYLGAWRRFHV